MTLSKVVGDLQRSGIKLGHGLSHLDFMMFICVLSVGELSDLSSNSHHLDLNLLPSCPEHFPETGRLTEKGAKLTGAFEGLLDLLPTMHFLEGEHAGP